MPRARRADSTSAGSTFPGTDPENPDRRPTVESLAALTFFTQLVLSASARGEVSNIQADWIFFREKNLADDVLPEPCNVRRHQEIIRHIYAAWSGFNRRRLC